MRDRSVAIDSFLTAQGWAAASRLALTADASSRSYTRLVRSDTGASALLMDWPNAGAGLVRYLSVSSRLRTAGLTAPKIVAQDDALGLAIIEDLGDSLFARVLEVSPGKDATLYHAAVDGLIAVQSLPLQSNDPQFHAKDLIAAADAAVGWYPGIDASVKGRLLNELEAVLAPTDAIPRVFTHRDYHAENLFWLPENSGLARLGVIDFQDAVAGHPAYDLVSLLSDVRREVGSATRAAAMRHYLEKAGHEEELFLRDAAAISAQRNLRVLTQFARLALRDGKPAYLSLMPRAWDNLRRDLAHPYLTRLRDVIDANLRPPGPSMIEELREQCREIADP